MSNKVLFIFQAIDKYTAVGKKIAKTTREINKSFKEAGALSKKFGKDIVKMGIKAKKVSSDIIAPSKSLVLYTGNVTKALVAEGRQAKVTSKQLRVLSQQTGFATEKVVRGSHRIVSANNRTMFSYKRQMEVLRKYTRQLKKTSLAQIETARKASSVGGELTAKLTLPIGALGAASLIQAAKMESLGISFEVMTKSAAKGKKTLDEMIQFAATTPFRLNEVMDASKLLLSYTVKAKDLNRTMRMLGDIAAGTGKPLKEFALVFGQVKALGQLTGEEARQFAEKGAALTATLAELRGVSTKQIKELISKGRISFKEFEKALMHMTSAQGLFFNLTDRLSKSTGGLFSTLQGEISLTTAAIGKFLIEEFKINDLLKSIIGSLKGFREGFKTFTQAHPIMTNLIFAFVAFLALLGPIIVALAQMAIAFAAIKVVLAVVGFFLGGITIPIWAIIGVVALLGTAAFMLWKNWEGVVGGLKELFTSLGNVVHKVFMAVFGGPLKLIDLIWEKLGPLQEGIKAFASGVANVLTFGTLDIFGSSKTEVDINISDPGGMVQDTKQATKTSGVKSGLNIGVNMEGA